MIFKGKDDLTREIEEYYEGKGGREKYKDPWEIKGESEKSRKIKSVGYDISEAEGTEYIDHSKHSFDEEIEESDKNYNYSSRKRATANGRSQKGSYTNSTRYNTKNRNTVSHQNNNNAQDITNEAGIRTVKRIIMTIALIWLIIILAINVWMAGYARRSRSQSHYEPTPSQQNATHINDYNDFYTVPECESADFGNLPYSSEVKHFARYLLNNESESIHTLISAGKTDLDKNIVEPYRNYWSCDFYFTDIETEQDVRLMANAMYDIQTFLSENAYDALVYTYIVKDGIDCEIWTIGCDDINTVDEYAEWIEDYKP